MARAIETAYKGYRFRSRTEARWAVYFDVLGIEWEYEAEGYKLSDGSCYLPDFKLLLPDRLLSPTGTLTYCEVKPEEFDDFDNKEMHQRWVFSNDLQSKIILLSGIPCLRAYDMIVPNRPFKTLRAVFFQDYGNFIGYVDDYWLQSMAFDETTGRNAFDMDEDRAGKAFGKKIPQAINAAKSARFEYGESPLVPLK